MEKAKFLYLNYEESRRTTVQDTREKKKVRRYTKKGYYIQEERNGFYVLVLSAKLNVTLENLNGRGTFNMKDDILDLYTREKISPKLVEKFEQECLQGIIVFEMNDECSDYKIKRNK